MTGTTASSPAPLPTPTSPDILIPQIFQARLKSHDVLQEHLKQVIVVSSAVLALTVTFIKDLLGNKYNEVSYDWLLPCSWVLFAVAIFFSIYGIVLMVNNLDNPNRSEVTKSYAAGTKTVQPVVLLGISTFAFGMLSFGGFGALNYKVLLNSEKTVYKMISETQAIDEAKKRISSDFSFLHLKKIELIKGLDEFPQSFPIWHVQLDIKENKNAENKGVVVKSVDYYIDALTGSILKES